MCACAVCFASPALPDKSKTRAPLLVLWENSLSETVIPLAVSAHQKDELENLGDGVLAEVSIAVERAGARPDYARLVSFRLAMIHGTPRPALTHASQSMPK